jgi:hypothetical protein
LTVYKEQELRFNDMEMFGEEDASTLRTKASVASMDHLLQQWSGRALVEKHQSKVASVRHGIC